MKKYFLSILTLLFLLISVGCTSEKAGILFNKNPITEANALDNVNVFSPNQRIYYLIFIPKPVETKKIEIQIIKKDNDEERLGYQLYWSRSAVMKVDQMYYYDDYVVISEPGAYVMQIYSKDKPTKRLCMAPFWVRN